MKMKFITRLLIAVVIIAIAAVLGIAAHASITLTNPETHAANGAVDESNLLAAASEVHIYRASKEVRLVYAVGNAGANGEVLMGAHTTAYTLIITDWSTGAWKDSLGASGTLTGGQRTALQAQLNSICDGAENLALALNKIAGTKNPC
jgi:hypothetical protein